MISDVVSSYLPGKSIHEFERDFQDRFPEMASALWLDRPGVDTVLGPMFVCPNEFESDENGRGDSYRRAHQQSDVKAVGVNRLLEFATGRTNSRELPAGYRLLDVLGGDGTVARAARRIPSWSTSRRWILTGDLSAQMVLQAMAYGLPAIRLAAQFLPCRDESFDSVLIAYGAHHIPKHQRVTCYADALRVLRPGGRLVLHDFETGAPTANWFETVVNSYSPNGHEYSHFVGVELETDLIEAGFDQVEVTTIYDPIIVHAAGEKQARQGILQYLLDSYGLSPNDGRNWNSTEAFDWVEAQVARCIQYRPEELEELGEIVSPLVRTSGTLSTYPTSDGWVGELPRTALVGVAEKSK